MEFTELRRHLDAEYTLLVATVATGPDAEVSGRTVPSCPDRSLDDLVRHVGEVYFHKADCIRLNARPTRERDLTGFTSRQVLANGYALLVEVFDSHTPDDPAYTWFVPDQSVGFWIRRMAHETAIHRFDAQLAVGSPTEIDGDLAEDGIDELLTCMLVADIQPSGYTIGRPDIEVRTPLRSWFVHFERDALRIDAHGAPDSVVSGDASTLLPWLYRRTAGDGIRFAGNPVGIGVLSDLLAVATR